MCSHNHHLHQEWIISNDKKFPTFGKKSIPSWFETVDYNFIRNSKKTHQVISDNFMAKNLTWCPNFSLWLKACLAQGHIHSFRKCCLIKKNNNNNNNINNNSNFYSTIFIAVQKVLKTCLKETRQHTLHVYSCASPIFTFKIPPLQSGTYGYEINTYRMEAFHLINVVFRVTCWA